MPVKHHCQLVLYRRAQNTPNHAWISEWSSSSSSSSKSKPSSTKKSTTRHQHSRSNSASYTHIDLSRGAFIRSRSRSSSSSSGGSDSTSDSDSDDCDEEAMAAHRAAYRELLTPRLLPSSAQELVRSKAREKKGAVKTIELGGHHHRSEREAEAVLGMARPGPGSARRSGREQEVEVVTIERPVVLTVSPSRSARRGEVAY